MLISKGSTNGASLIGFTVNENDVVSDKKSSLTTAKISACPKKSGFKVIANSLPTTSKITFSFSV